MGGCVSTFESGGALDCCARPPQEVNLNGPVEEVVCRTNRTNFLVVHVSNTESERIRAHTRVGRQCAVEIEFKVIRGRVTAVQVSVDRNPTGARKLVALPVHPEPEVSPAASPQGAPWGQAFNAGFSPQAAAASASHSASVLPLPGSLGAGGVRLRLTSAVTNNFEPGDYFLSWNTVVAGSALVKVVSLVEQVPGQGLQPLQVITHQQRLIPDIIPDVSINWGNGAAPARVDQFGQPLQPMQQQQQQQQQQLHPHGPFAVDPYGGPSSSPVAPRLSSGSGQPQSFPEALHHIANLERELAAQNAEISALKRSNRNLDEKVYNLERGRGSSTSASNEMQLSRYKEYILKAKEVIAQQKERILDLETTTLVGRLEGHMIEYKEYAQRQAHKLEEVSRDLEGVDQENRELRKEVEELRARYNVMRRESTSAQVRGESSPRRTPHYRRVALQPSRSGMQLPGGYDAPRSPQNDRAYTHAAAMSQWEHEGIRAPKTPTAGTNLYAERRDRERERDPYALSSPPAAAKSPYARDPYARDPYAREGDMPRSVASPSDRREEVRREHEREWAAEYQRSHGYAAPPGANPYSLPGAPPPVVAAPPGNYGYSRAGRHRNAVDHKRSTTRHYYDRYGGATDPRVRAAMKIQAAWRGFVQRRRERRARSGYTASSTKFKASTTHVPAGHRSSPVASRKPLALNPVSSSSSRASGSKTTARPSSSTTRAPSSSSSSSSHKMSKDEAARKIQREWRRHDDRRRARTTSSSSSKPHRSSSKHSSDRDRERERERDRDRARSSKY